MKDHKTGLAIFAALALALPLSVTPMFAKGYSPAASAAASGQMQQSRPNTRPQRETRKQPQAYVGTIIKAQNGKCKIKIGKYEYKLTDQSRAAQFLGKKVMVTGVYNVHSGTIHVSQIKPAPSH